MRYFHKLRNKFHCPTVNIDHLWSLVLQEFKDKATKDNVPVVDVTQFSYFKVLGKGLLPTDKPVVVKAKLMSKEAGSAVVHRVISRVLELMNLLMKSFSGACKSCLWILLFLRLPGVILHLFCDEFFGEESMFYDIFAGPFLVIDEHLNTVLPNCFDAIGLMLMIRIIYQHQLIMSRRRIPCLDSYLDKVNISLWPRFKMVFDMHVNSLRNANIRSLWEDDVLHIML